MTLFSPITYHISASLPPTLLTQLDLILQANGATRASGTKDPKLNIVISDSLRFDGWEDIAARRSAGAAEGGSISEDKQSVHVVTANFVERSVIIGKLQQPQYYSVDPSMFFSGVIACGSDLPASDLEVLSGGITGLGGQWRSALTNECTHLFAISADSPKYQTAMHFKHETGIKIVLPHWFDDCVRLGIRGLSEEMYEWPECRILKGPDGLLPSSKDKRKEEEKVVDKDIEKEREKMKRNLFITAAKFTPSMNRSSPPSDADLTLVAPSSRRGASPNMSNLSAFLPITASRGGDSSIAEPHAVWEGRIILLSRTLQLYGHRREAVQRGVERAGGVVLRYEGDDEEQEDVDGVPQGQGQGWNERLGRQERRRRRREAECVAQCDVLVTRWRHGRGYIEAVRTHKMVGTLAWLFHVQSCGIITHPINQLLHYPVPKRPIEAFQNHVITVTNYTGEAREYLKRLVSAMGAEFTPSMSGANTALVAAYTSGTKAQKALSWSIPVVNHLWLEDCFISWRNLTVANEKYIIFRPGDDFSKRLGERGLAVGVANGISGAYGCARVDPEEVQNENEREDRELGRIEQEAEELAEDEDDLGNSDIDAAEEVEEEREKEKERQAAIASQKELLLPNGTEASMREVMDDLVHDQGGGADFDMDVDVDFQTADLDPAKVSTPKKTKTSARENEKAKTSSPIKPIFNPSVAAARPKPVPKKKRQKTPMEEEEREEEVVQAVQIEDSSEEEEVPKKQTAVKYAKKTTVAPVSPPSKPATSKTSSKDKAKATSKSSDEEDVDREDDVASPSPELKRQAKKTKAITKEPSPSSEEEDEEIELDPPPKAKPGKQNVKSTESLREKMAKDKKRVPVEEEEESTPQPPPPPKTKPQSKTQSRRTAIEPEEDEEDVEAAPAPTKPKAKAGATTSRVGGLLGRVKGDARTRIKKKKETVKPVVESEDEDDMEEEEEHAVLKRARGKGKEVEKDTKPRKKGKEVDQDDEDEVEVLVKSRSKVKSKKKTTASSEEEEVEPPPKKRAKKPSPPPTKARSKPLRVYSTEEEDVDDDDDDEIPAAASDGSDEDLPENPIISSRSQKPTNEKEKKSTSASKSKLANRSASKVKAKKAPTPSDSETEEEEEEEKPPPRKANGKTSPIKRVVSVLMPSLQLSPRKVSTVKEKEDREAKGKGKGKKAVEVSSDEEQEKEPKPAAKSKKAVSKMQPKPTAKGKAKAKATPHVESENVSEEEAEVSVLVSPRAARGLARTESIRAVAGQSVANLNPSKTTASTSISAGIRLKKASNAMASSSKAVSAAPKSKARPRDDSMDVDSISTSAAAISAPLPRRSAAAKATQRLHETIIPDLVQFEAQMKKSKRGSSYASAAFALVGEEDVSQTSEKRKQVDDNDNDGKSTKKRRTSNVVLEEDGDTVPARGGTKGKGKSKDGVAVDDDAMAIEDDKASPGHGIMIMTTQVTLGEDVIKALVKLGVKMTSRPSECTHLLAPHVIRTEKFLCALASRAPWILQEKWATESARLKRILPEKDFVLKDKTGENKYGVNLTKSLKRAKELKETGGLLSGHTFYLTPRVPVDTKLLKNVVVACGGLLSTQTPTLRIINASPSMRHVVSCKEDIAIWRPLAFSRSVKIYTQELILTGILKQDMEWNEVNFFVPGSF